MKNRNQENNVWKDEMVRRWEDLVLMYQKMQESPHFKIVVKFLLELLKIILRILAKKLLDALFDEA